MKKIKNASAVAVIHANANHVAAANANHVAAANANHVNAKMKITKKTKFSEIIQDEQARGILMEKGMHCFGCPMAMSETLEQGAEAHGIDSDELINEINKRKKRK